MNRLLILLLASLILHTASAQEFSSMRTTIGTIVYSDSDGNWLQEDEWKNKYGRKAFRNAFPENGRYDHVQTPEYIRWNFRQAITNVGDMRWSRVFESELNIEELKEAAKILLEDSIVEGDKVIGYLTNKSFYDFYKGLWTIENYKWSAKVIYEFRDGRYKVTMTNIKVQCDISMSVFSRGFSINKESNEEPLRDMLYNGSSQRATYEPYINSIDHTFSNITYLRVDTTGDNW